MAGVAAHGTVTGGPRTSVILGGAFLGGALAVLAVRHGSPLMAGLGAADGAVLSFLAAFDVLTLRAPNRIVYPCLLLIPGGAFLGGGEVGLDALAGGIAAFAILALVQKLGRGAMGFGDVKVAALSGMVVGLRGVLPMLGVAFVTGGVVAAAVLLLGIGNRKDSIAFTPFLGFGVVAVLASMDLYLVR